MTTRKIKQNTVLIRRNDPRLLIAASLAFALSGQVLMYFFKLPVLGIIFFFAAAFFLWRHEENAVKSHEFKISLKTEAVLLFFIIITAAIFRLAYLDLVPAGCFSDEADLGLFAKKIFAEGPSAENLIPVALSGQTYHPCPAAYIAAAFFKLFGPGLTQLRLVSAAAGIIAVPALYFLLRSLIGVLPALAGAFLLASMRWHVNFSRIGMDGVLVATLAILTAYFLAAAYLKRKTFYFVMAGFTTALSQYSYLPGRLVFVWLAVLAVYAAVKDRKFIAENFKKILLAAVVAAVFLAPLAGYYIKNPGHFLKRASEVLIFDKAVVKSYWGEKKTAVSAFAETIQKTFGMFNVEGDNNGRHNLPGKPMLDFLTGMAALAGFIYALKRILNPKYFFFISFFAVFIIPGLISIEPPQALRTIIVIPAAVFFAALYIDKITRGAAIRPAFIIAALLALLLTAGVENAYVYFRQQAVDTRCTKAFYEEQYQLAKYLKNVEPGRRIIVYKELFVYNQLFYFIAGSRAAEYEVFDPNNPFLESCDTKNGAVYVLPRNYRQVADVLMGVYPNSKKDEARDPYNGHDFLFMSILVPQQDIINWDTEGQKHGLTAEYYRGTGWKGKPILTEKKQFIVYEWRKQPVMTPSSARWSGRIKIEKPGEYAFGVQSRDYADLYIDGKKVVVNRGFDTLEEKTIVAEGSVNLNEGFHEIVLRQDIKRYFLRLNLWWKVPGAAKNSLVPPGVLYYK